MEHLRTAQRKRPLQRHDDQSPELMAELEALRDDIQQKETSLSRLRDENERLRRTKASESSPSVMSLAHQLSNVLSIPAAPDASTEQVTERVMEHVIRNMREVESLRLQVSQLNGNEEAMCSKLVEEQSRSQALEMELAQANCSLADHRKAAADVKVKVAASSQEKSRNASQVELLRNQVKGLESRLVQSELAKARCDAQRAEAESELADLKSGSKDYEKMVKTLTEERDEAKELAQSSMMLHKQETKSLKGCLLLADSATHAEVLDKIVALSDGNGKLSGDSLRLTKDTSSTSLELKATKETLKRLAADMKALQKSSASHSEDIRRLEQEKADLTERVEQSSKKCQELRELLLNLDKDKIQCRTAQDGVQWHFNPPDGPHFGGAHEALVKSAKRALGTTLTGRHCTDEELCTAITGAEALMNSRPLSYQSADPGDPLPLTPNHFLFGQVTPFVPEGVDETPFKPQQRWRFVQDLVAQLWR